MSEPKYAIGDDLYVSDPARFVGGAVNITGRVQTVSKMLDGEWAYTLAAYIGRVGGCENPPEGQAMRFAERDLGLRLGTPINQISGRPGHPGYGEFKRIADSWGYD